MLASSLGLRACKSHREINRAILRCSCGRNHGNLRTSRATSLLAGPFIGHAQALAARGIFAREFDRHVASEISPPLRFGEGAGERSASVAEDPSPNPLPEAE